MNAIEMRKQPTPALAESEARFRKVFEENGSVMLIVGPSSGAEQRVQRLSKLYAALRQCNQAIVHCVNEDELFSQICRCVVENDFAKTAWIGLVDAASKRVKPVALYGEHTGCLEQIPWTVDADSPYGFGPTGAAIRGNQPQWCQDFLHDATTASWHGCGEEAGWGSSASLPLCRGGRPVGCLSIYSGTVNAFDDDAQKLLVEMAMDISFALDNLARETERRRAAEALRASEARYRTAFQTSLNAVEINRLSDGMCVDVNKPFLDIMGYERDEVVGHTSLELNIWANESDRQNLIKVLRRDSHCRDFEALFRKKNGELLWGLMSASIIEIDGVDCLFSVTRDLSDIKGAEDEIKNLAFFDPLTRLPNRRLLMDRLRQSLATTVRGGRKRALLLIDLDNFKTLNDILGLEMGDALLQDVARRLTSCVREADTVARLGGDEFVVMLEHLSESSEAAAACAKSVGKKILAAIGQPYWLTNHEYRITASIGITIFGDQRESVGEFLKQSDIAMYQAKAAGRNTIRFFAPALQAAINARASMEEDLLQGIRNDQFLLFYQPQVDCGCVIGAEALIRWIHPERGMVSPGEFIPLAEETGLILPLGNWVLETACNQLAAWADQPETRHITLAVNVSARQFRQPDFVDQVLTVLDRTGANPQNLKLELTESMLVDNVEDVITKMTALKSRGLSFSLDDFGTGYSSLSYLKRLPLDQLKIDQSFVRDVLEDPNDVAIAQTIVALGQAMRLSVIAEGVETEEQRDFLASVGCRAYQGYLFGRPLPLEGFERYFRRV
jgi:diguanylate cyclase (GGDEF)-like protein/PAS domain S-box-containing protein